MRAKINSPGSHAIARSVLKSRLTIIKAKIINPVRAMAAIPLVMQARPMHAQAVQNQIRFICPAGAAYPNHQAPQVAVRKRLKRPSIIGKRASIKGTRLVRYTQPAITPVRVPKKRFPNTIIKRIVRNPARAGTIRTAHSSCPNKAIEPATDQ